MVKLPEEENTPDKRVNKIFDVMDKVRKCYFSLCVMVVLLTCLSSHHMRRAIVIQSIRYYHKCVATGFKQ